ncbi:hypothetical protein MUY14_10795 [Amycolatopsis sp. FBCC-B4732]|uniref:hypothetical protein n=1 Tax=Amycolatopsis sp. FBCC-B4732 TaxID=3079339 RepID=UPI001FF0F9B9|nr:hypothetical protein [Amycolatopsis sp. FBCC-B4732]UOX91076.1 hypothetical protein MUY14_10795 [Amycolatopsis sp. FBCC-B4732]
MWTNPPSFTFNPSSPLTLPRTFPNTFAIFSKMSTSFDSSGETFRIVSVSFLSSSPIFLPHFAIAADACATTTGVPKPREKTSSITHAISLPTRSAISCRTVSRTNDTTWPMIIVTVLIAPATVAAPERASLCSAANVRYASAPAPVQPVVPFLTALSKSVLRSPSALDTLPHVSA